MARELRTSKEAHHRLVRSQLQLSTGGIKAEAGRGFAAHEPRKDTWARGRTLNGTLKKDPLLPASCSDHVRAEVRPEAQNGPSVGRKMAANSTSMAT